MICQNVAITGSLTPLGSIPLTLNLSFLVLCFAILNNSSRVSQVPTLTVVACHTLRHRPARYYSDVAFAFPTLAQPDNLKYLSVLHRLRVIIPTQWPTTFLCTLHLLRYLTGATLGTEPSKRLPRLDLAQCLTS